MRNLLTIGLLLCTASSFAQTDKIVQLLNEQFAKEQKMYHADYESDKPTLVQPFQIENDTLSVEFSYPAVDNTEHIVHYFRKICFKDIEGFEKDMNVLFTAKEALVKEIVTTKGSDGSVLQSKINYSNLFFTELRKDQRDELLQKKIIKAFKKAGNKIKGNYWYH